MKKILISLMALGSLSSIAAPLYTCKLPSLKTKLSISKQGGDLTYSFKGFDSGEVVEVFNFKRSDFEKDVELQSIMLKTGLKVENFINATAYITDSNSIGRSGLIVFKGGRSRAVAMSYFNGPTDYVQKCK